MMKIYEKKMDKVLMSIEDLKKYLGNYNLSIFDDYVEIKEMTYAESYKKDFKKAKQAPDSDFLNL